MLGHNMFAYCLNCPVQYTDREGKNAIEEAADWWTSIMWWLSAVDGPYPIGEIIYAAGVVILYGISFFVVAEVSADVAADAVAAKEKEGQEDKKTRKVGKQKKKTRKSGKEKASDRPSWVDQSQIDPNLSPQKNATNLLNQKYGPGNWNKGPGSEFNQICKWIERSLFTGAAIEAATSDYWTGGAICTVKP